MKNPFRNDGAEYDIYRPGMNYNAPEDEGNKNFFLREIKVGEYGFTRRQFALFIAINICLISLALNFILTPRYLWFLPVTALMATAILIIYAISDKRSLLRNIRRSAGLWCIAFLFMQYFLLRGNWAVDFAIPLVVIAYDIYLLVILFKSKSKLSAVLFSTIVIAVHTIYPLILLSLGYTGGTLMAKTAIWLAFVLTFAMIVNLSMFRLVALKTKINKRLQ